ncbi:MAG: HAMP domain-containing sensor histidine kinase [candidate division Zixibacteria bacterium]
MELSKRTVGIIITIIVISLIGLIALQSYLLGVAAKQKEQGFDRNVNAAMSTAIMELEAVEISDILLGDNDSVSVISNIREFEGDTIDCIEDSVDIYKKRLVHVHDGVLNYRLDSPQHVSLFAFNADGSNKSVIVDTVKTPGEYSILLQEDDSAFGSNYTYQFQSDSIRCAIKVVDGLVTQVTPADMTGSEKHVVVAMTLDRLTDAEWIPIEKRIDSDRLDSVLTKTFQSSGIDLDFAFGVQVVGEDTMRIARPADLKEDLARTEFRAGLFPRDLFAPQSNLLVYFPDRDIYILKQTGPLLFLTVVFMLVIVGCFIYTIHTIITQKRFAGHLVDFINNMTHEFKTPISTISLAGEAIDNPDVLSDKKKILHFNKVIQDENIRMRNQVDRILQMAVLEKGDYKLEFAYIDVHDILSRIIKNVALRVEGLNGEINTNFLAENRVISADAVHLLNIVNNLIDNAIKYSDQNPEVTVSTKNERGGIVISVEDKGIGIDPKAQTQVFDKYYRVPTGNIHNVKGFGLGLSYVKLMVDAHGGGVSVKSQKGLGTTVEVYFPGAKKADE